MAQSVIKGQTDKNDNGWFWQTCYFKRCPNPNRKWLDLMTWNTREVF